MVGGDQLQLFLLGAGECLVDNVEVIPSGGANLVANGTFDAGTSGWYFQGTHEESAWQASGGFSGGCLHIVASDRGDTAANRIRTVLTQTLAEGSTATLRAKVRWLKGHPEILLRLHGNWLEATGNTLTTRDLGSPGGRNTQFQTNAGPAITDVRHWPVLPDAGQAVTVTAQIEDADGIAQAVVKYRVDPASNYVTVPMNYCGAGFFSGTIPGQTSGGPRGFLSRGAGRLHAQRHFPFSGRCSGARVSDWLWRNDARGQPGRLSPVGVSAERHALDHAREAEQRSPRRHVCVRPKSHLLQRGHSLQRQSVPHAQLQLLRRQCLRLRGEFRRGRPIPRHRRLRARDDWKP
jgi:hypothetical protein